MAADQPSRRQASARRFHAGAWSDDANGLYIHGGDSGGSDELWFFSRQAGPAAAVYHVYIACVWSCLVSNNR